MARYHLFDAPIIDNIEEMVTESKHLLLDVGIIVIYVCQNPSWMDEGYIDYLADSLYLYINSISKSHMLYVFVSIPFKIFSVPPIFTASILDLCS